MSQAVLTPAPPAGAARARPPLGLAAGLLLAVVVLAALCAASLAWGSRSIPLGRVVDAVLHPDGSADAIVVRSLRVPRTLVGLEVGVALGLAGAVMQGVTRNPLADPGLLGVTAGASLAVVLAIRYVGLTTLSGYVWFAFVGAAAAGAVVYGLGAGRAGQLGSGDGATPARLALAGVAVTAAASSVTSAVLLLDPTTLDAFRFWVVGSLSGRTMAVASQVAPFIAVGTVVALLLARPLNVLALGDDVARALGQRVGPVRAVAALAAVVLAGAATAAAGPIVFLGLAVPHVARLLCGPDQRWLLAYSAVLAPILLLAADILGRLVARPQELQVGVLTALLGAPLLVVLVRRRAPVSA